MAATVFVHIGPEIPAHAADAIRQAVRFGSRSVYLLGNAGAFATFPAPNESAPGGDP